MVFSRLSEPIRKALAFEGYSVPTPIQTQAIPPSMAGKDILGIAQTGTGKTAAFMLPILERLSMQKKVMPSGTPRVLILAPTRELAAQIGDSCKKYGKHLHITHTTIFGGVRQGPQVSALRRGVDILVATPGRLLDLMQQRYVFLNRLEVFVLDEADRMLDMGFLPDVKRIITKLPTERQTMFFSATMSPSVSKLAVSMVNHPVRVEVTPEATTVETISQKVLFVDQKKKDALLWLLLEQDNLDKVLVFTRTKHRADKVARMLNKKGLKADPIHGNRSQKQRTQALRNFHIGRSRVLVATDIAARGIDVKDISHVINYDLPNEAENYVHRVGRTARAGKDGVAYSFCAADERSYLHAIEKLIKMKIQVEKHLYHSDEALNAKGAAAKPKPRGQWSRSRSQGRSRRPFNREVKPRLGSGKPMSRGRPGGGKPSRGGKRPPKANSRGSRGKPNRSRAQLDRKPRRR
ncbi:DEAD/DEAH box helicase [Candidatus Woesearchaeota archaeon]|nr:DEAD/DEAH box helicase [Candidatus Woesearchaeota archaeon]